MQAELPSGMMVPVCFILLPDKRGVSYNKAFAEITKLDPELFRGEMVTHLLNIFIVFRLRVTGMALMNL